MSTYSDMQTRIADEIMRSDLTNQIKQQIQSAIVEYQDDAFYFNQKANASWSTIANQETYSSTDTGIADIADIVRLTVIYSGTRLEVDQREWDEIEDWQTGTFKGGAVTDFAYFEQKFRLFPIPSTVMTLNLAYRQSIAGPSADSDVGVWMNEAEELIRCAAKKRLFAHVINNDTDAMKMQTLETDALGVLRRKTARLIGTGRMIPTQF